jgi:glutamate/tyrosine decarboxylase-like PLP-dependent enzyme
VTGVQTCALPIYFADAHHVCIFKMISFCGLERQSLPVSYRAKILYGKIDNHIL